MLVLLFSRLLIELHSANEAARTEDRSSTTRRDDSRPDSMAGNIAIQLLLLDLILLRPDFAKNEMNLATSCVSVNSVDVGFAIIRRSVSFSLSALCMLFSEYSSPSCEAAPFQPVVFCSKSDDGGHISAASSSCLEHFRGLSA